MDHSEVDEKPARAKRPKRRFSPLRLMGAVFALLTLALFMAVAGLLVALESGPVSLKLFEERIAQELRKQAPDTPITFGRAQLTLENDRGDNLPRRMLVELLDLTVRDDAGRIAAFTPRVAAAVTLPALYRGDWTPDELIFDDISAIVIRDQSGRLTVGDASTGDEGAGQAVDLLGLIGDSYQGQGGGPQKILLNNATIIYRDDMGGRLLRASDVDIFLSRQNDNYQASLELDVDGGIFGRQTLAIQAFLASDDAVTIAAEFSNIDLRDIASQVQALDWLGQLAAPVAGRFEVALDPDGNVLALEGAFDSGAGRLVSADWAEPITKAGFDFVFDADDERFLIKHVHLSTATLDLDGDGVIEIDRDEDGETQAFTAQLSLNNAQIVRPEIWARPVRIEQADITSRLNVYPLKLEIGEASFNIDGARLSGIGTVWRQAGQWRADFQAEAANATIEQVIAYWPLGLAPNTKEGIRKRIRAANIPEASIAVRILPDDLMLDLGFDFDDTTIAYLDGHPDIVGAQGAARLSPRMFAMDFADARIQTPQGDIDLSGSKFRIHDIDTDQEYAQVLVQGDGPATASMAVAALEPVGVSAPNTMPVSITGGRALTTVEFTAPLDKPLAEAEIDPSVLVTLINATAIVGKESFELAAPKSKATYQSGALNISGEGVIDQRPISFDVNADLKHGRQTIAANGVMGAALLQKMGVDAEWLHGGTVGYDAKLIQRQGETATEVALQLDNAEIALPDLGYHKDAGEPLSLSALISETDAGTSLTDLNVQGPNVAAVGEMVLAPDGRLQMVDFSNLAIPGLFSGALSLQQSQVRWTGDIEAQFINLDKFRTILDQPGQSGDGLNDLRARIDFKVARLQATETIHMSSVQGGLRLSAGDVGMKMTGLIGGNAAGVVTYRENPEGVLLVVTSDDAGQALRAAGFFDDGSGGDLRLRIESDAANPDGGSGRLHIDNMVIHEDAKLEQIMIGAERRDLRAKMSKEGIRFKKVRAPFQIVDDVVVVKKAYARGDEVGFTVGGEYQMTERTLDLDGVFTPFYAINSVVSNVPLLGPILTGGDGQGLFAFSYSVKGSADDPKVRVNPLSVLAPGIIKLILSGGGSDLPPPETDAQDR